MTLLSKCRSKPRKYIACAATIGFTFVLLFVIVICIYGVQKINQSRRLNQGFAELKLGDTAEKVTKLMGPPHRVRMGDNRLLFPDAPHDAEHVFAPGKIDPVVQFSYSVKTVYMPVTWVMGFDNEMKLVSKMRLD